MRTLLVVLGFGAIIALTPVEVVAQGNNCTFPGQGKGVGGTPGKKGSPGTFPGGGATGGTFPGGNCSSTPTVSASEPLALGLTAVALLGASLLGRRRAKK